MITTITLNPAVDKTYTVPNLVIGQVNRMRSSSSFPGGKGINVARIIHQLGGEVTATGFLGGYNGRFIEDALKHKFSCQFIKTSEETRCNINILGEDGYVTEILEPGPEIKSEELQSFQKKYDELLKRSEVIVLSGSIPKGIESDIYKGLIEKAKQADKRIILDTSSEALKKAITAKPYLVKPNQRELEFIVGKKLSRTEQLAEAALHLYKKGISHVLVSRGEKGILYVGEKGKYIVQIPKIKAVNTVGCGDSIVAVMALGMERGIDIYELLKEAAATSVANAITSESASIPVFEIERIKKEVKILDI